jgi:hypothetical protein
MGAAMAVLELEGEGVDDQPEETEPVEEIDPDEFASDDDDEEEDEEPGERVHREPHPALLQVEATAKAFMAAVRSAVWAVYEADFGPEPFDQGTLIDIWHEIADIWHEIARVEEFCEEKRSELDTRTLDNESNLDFLRDPPGYPKGTYRFGPLTPDEVKEVRDQVYGPFDRYHEVKAREGIILFAWRESCETLPGHIGYVHPNDPLCNAASCR